MSDMPKRLFANFDDMDGFYAVKRREFKDETEYVRADLVAAKDAQLLAANAEIARLTAELVAANNEVDALREDLKEDW